MQPVEPQQSDDQEQHDHGNVQGSPPQRVLVVDEDGALHRRIAAACSNWHVDANIARVDSFLKAMGQVVKPLKSDDDKVISANTIANAKTNIGTDAIENSDANENTNTKPVPYPHVLVGQLGKLNGQFRDSAQALKELSPNTRLVLIAPTDVNGQAELALTGGFDEVLIEPIGDETLVNAIQPKLSTTKPIPGSTPGPTPASVQVPEVDSASDPMPATDGDAVAVIDAPTTLLPFDTAVIEQMLNPHGSALADALAIIRNQPGLAQVQLSEPSKKPWHHIAVEVTLNGKTFGELHAPPPVLVEQLQPWAAWLARWHALQNQVSDLWQMSMTDELTETWNLRYFKRHLQLAVDRASEDQSAVTLMLFDIDNFKQYNDQFGHGAGDDILRETVRLMRSAVRDHDVIARIGGDEFAVVFWDADEPRRSGSQHPVDIKKITSRFRKLIRNYSFPKLAEGAPGKLTISAGLAGFPLDGLTPDELIKKADDMLMDSKRHGKDAIQFGPGAMKNGFSDGD